ncbi:hypothetical protein BJ741DRAFT_615509 [Chytriomyces cf. hyalinus JEL632]|nr:hypothetical protein BJ741DRAFT_615509 [Chytriomyces cf. hyalinus JEL632]
MHSPPPGSLSQQKNTSEISFMASRVLLQALLPRTTLATATFFSADIASQLITASTDPSLSIHATLASFSTQWDPIRSLKTASFGLGIVSWYGFSSSFLLTKAFPVGPGGIRFSTAVLQAAAQQALFAPPLTFSFLYASAALVHDDPTAFETAKEQMPDVGALAWTFLPWMNALATWGLRAPGLRLAALNSIAFTWAAYLATVATPGNEAWLKPEMPALIQFPYALPK